MIENWTVATLHRELTTMINEGHGDSPIEVIDVGDFHTPLCSAYLSENYIGSEPWTEAEGDKPENWTYTLYLTQD